MKTAVSAQHLRQKYINYFLLSTALAFIGVAFLILMAAFALPTQKTAVSTTPVPVPETFSTMPDPVQTAVSKDEAVIHWETKSYKWELTPRAQFQVTGRVLSRQLYTNDWQAEIAPLDLALGWGELSDVDTDKWVRWGQSGRWYYYRWPKDAPFSEKYLQSHSTNIHIVPATDSLETALLKIQEDDKIILEGKLIDVEAANTMSRWQNKTSLTRTDTGSGACEILLVERLIWNGQAYN
jgi:hypothetical protein